MKHYVPKLIPEKYRVLPDYFRQENPLETTPVTDPVDYLWWALAGVFTLISLFVWTQHAGFGLCLLLFAFFASPWGRHRVEKGLRFYFTSSLKAGVLGLLAVASVVTGQQYRQQVAKTAEALRLEGIEKQRIEQEANRQHMIRLDSLRSYLTLADASLKKGAYIKSINLYSQSLRFASESNGVDNHHIWTGLAESYVRTRQYQQAIKQYDKLIAERSSDPEYQYKRALCYQKIGRKIEAISDLNDASLAGYKPATRLYNQLNPLLRRVLYYQTVCCDGSDSPSNAKGSGACSHHGGVCNWNKPIYKTYRKYDRTGF
ncbi:hypothetical protein [Spirosoma endophyticum]|uniref:Uncharacterized protein n=1 Tax=Spirosoma endophyticum TaxID=662367 RepID=A0A1I2FE61_9BACT|nr:hypothetical protein [Spirosoma endophyticum]SFF03038.1 hypothetical protein SAMN05216167_12546 [Spirosoma endophyticum]